MYACINAYIQRASAKLNSHPNMTRSHAGTGARARTHTHTHTHTPPHSHTLTHRWCNLKMVYADLALRGNENGGKGSLNMSMRAADGKSGEGPSARVMKPATGMKGMMCGLQLPLVLSSACCLSVCLSVCVRAC